MINAGCKEGSQKELDYIDVLDSRFKMSHLEKEQVKEDIRAKRLLRKSSNTEYSGKKIYEIDFESCKRQLKNPHKGIIDNTDEKLAKREKVWIEKTMKEKERHLENYCLGNTTCRI